MDNGGLVWRRIGDHADKNPSRWHALPECRSIETKATTAARRWLAVQMATMLTVYPDQCHSVHAPSARGVIIPLTWERSSRLGLTWFDGLWLAGCPQVKRALPTFVLAG
jgi:hypothetical protein